MGVSFKVAKAGTRYRPKLLQVEDKEYENDPPTDFQQRNHEGDLVGVEDKVADRSNALAKAKPEIVPVSKNIEVSFSLNLFGNGFSVGKVAEFFNDVPNLLHPYDRTSERLFSAIEYGCLPGELLDDIPSKYVNGALLCEIRDYRNCLPHRDDTAVSASIFPTVHKVLLQMCMENVIKDISSMSDDSWTYKDLLEVESRILKALQPNLHLNPKPMLDGSIGEPLTRKLNLKIARSRKKRKLSDAPVTNSHEKNVVQEPMLQSFPLPSQSNHQSAPSCNRPVSTTLTLSKFVSTPKQFYSNNNCGPTRPSTLVLSEKGSCDMHAIRGPILKKPKEEPLDFSQFQLPGSEGQTILGPDLQCKTKLTKQQLEAEKILRERFHGNKHPSLLINNGQQSILEGMPKLQSGMPTCSLKQELAETSHFLVSDVPKNRDNYLIMDVRSNQSNIQKLALRQSSPLSRMQFNHKDQPGNKNMRFGTLTPKRKALQNPQVSTSVRSAPVSSSHLDSVLREAIFTRKTKIKFSV
ncbi:hypothetical protein L1049_007019 [Liquidambar formosana]|uniref:Spt20-like SEP domain-containing protein n=1 Tax=Liquidambar formosana TaxID=63359 RepID=A0AAP0RI65_LIQFO